MKTPMSRNSIKTVLKWMAWITGIWMTILVALELFLTSSALTGIVNKVASEFIDGELSFGKVELSMFKRFPSACLTMEDFSITYPADRFDEDENGGADGKLFRSGRGEVSDTLAAFKRFSASLRLGPAVTGKVRIPYIELTEPKIHAHRYSNGNANWNIFKMDDESEDTTSTAMPDIMLGRISLNGNPKIIYTDSKDTISALINLKRLNFRGKLNTKKTGSNRIGLRLDSLFAAGRLASDTLAFGLDRLRISEEDRNIKIAASAKTFAAIRGLGRLSIPIEISGDLIMPGRTGKPMTINDFTAEVAAIPMKVSGEVELLEDRVSMDLKAGIDSCKVSEVIKELVSDIVPESRNIITDSFIDFQAAIKGDYVYGSDRLPDVEASFRVPTSGISYKGNPIRVGLKLSADASTDKSGRLNIDRMKAEVVTKGADLNISGSIHDILCEDPCTQVDMNMAVTLDSLAKFIPDSLGISAAGDLFAELKGSIKLSQLDIYRFSDADIKGRITVHNINVTAPEDTLKAFISNAEATLKPEEKTSKRTGEAFRLLALKCSVDSTEMTIGGMSVKGKKVNMSAMNSTDYQDTSKVQRFGGRISAGRLIIADNAGTVMGISGSENGFQILPKKDNPKIPVLTLTSHNKAIFLKDNINRIILSDAELGADATMNSIERRQKARAYIDSLSRMYPDVPKDSLFIHMAQQRNRNIPEWLKEEDFRKQDINFRLDETLAKYFREWDLNGKIAVKKGMLMTPYFPLRNTLQGFEGHFNNNQVRIDSLGIKAGTSELAAKGSLTGIKRILSGRGSNMLDLDLDVTSRTMDANELMKAYSIGSRFNLDAHDDKHSEVSDDEYMEIITSDTTAYDQEASHLIVVPANLNADIRLKAENIKYSDLLIERMTANAIMKERCIQITNTSATSNVGNISFDGFYATRSKKDIKSGFNIQFKDITAEKVVSLMPAVDTLMPIINSFYGRLNCELAATAQLDTNMNLMIPSINGIMRITGDNLYIKDNQMFKSLARKLLFKNKNEGHIEHMSVEGIISDSTVEIFPFIIKMDRYTLAFSGLHNMDMSFKYHASLIRSPFLVKVGVDIIGEDFENWKFKIGKPKYKSADVPAFSSVIDETKVNLVKSIKEIFRRGIDAAIRKDHLETINEFRKRTNYVRAIDQQLEALSDEEQKQLEADEAAAAEENVKTDTTMNQ